MRGSNCEMHILDSSTTPTLVFARRRVDLLLLRGRCRAIFSIGKDHIRICESWRRRLRWVSRGRHRGSGHARLYLHAAAQRYERIALNMRACWRSTSSGEKLRVSLTTMQAADSQLMVDRHESVGPVPRLEADAIQGRRLPRGGKRPGSWNQGKSKVYRQGVAWEVGRESDR